MSQVPRYRVRERVREAIARRNWSQNRFARQCGLTSGHLSQLLSGKRLAGREVRERLLYTLKPMTFDELFEEVRDD